MKPLFLCLTFVLLTSCATTQAPQKWAITEKVVYYDRHGEVNATTVRLVPVKPFNFWSTLYDIGVGVAKKQGGL
jgi:hypothetical protein